MPRQFATPKFYAALGVLLLAVLCVLSSFAQTPPAPQYYRVQTIKLNPGMTDEWQKFYEAEMLPALKKAGAKQSSVWRVTQGDVRQIFIINPIDGLAQLDEPGRLANALGREAARAINLKHGRFIAEWHSNIAVGRPDLGIALAPNSPLKLGILITNTVEVGRTADYEKWIKENTLPAEKKINVKGVLAGKTFLGGDVNEYRTLILFDSYAEMDKFQTEYLKAAIELKLSILPPTGVLTRRESMVVRYLPELSIAPAPPKEAK